MDNKPQRSREEYHEAFKRLGSVKAANEAKEARDKVREEVGQKRLNELDWPKNWSRMQKRRCVAACKRAQKKGYTPNSPGWNNELKKAGFK